MFSRFSEAKITPRGSDIPNITNKLIVMWVRNLLPAQIWKWLFVPIWVLLSPIVITAIILAHISIWLGLGSTDDPLGYTIVVKK